MKKSTNGAAGLAGLHGNIFSIRGSEFLFHSSTNVLRSGSKNGVCGHSLYIYIYIYICVYIYIYTSHVFPI